MIIGNTIGGSPTTPKTIVFTTKSGEEIVASLVSRTKVLTATANDIREGKTALTDSGTITGTKKIPIYHSTEGTKFVSPGAELEIPIPDELNLYDFTKFQAIVCAYNTSISNSVSAEKIALNTKVYSVGSTTELSTITLDKSTQSIKFGVTNDSDKPVLIRYFTFKEIE